MDSDPTLNSLWSLLGQGGHSAGRGERPSPERNVPENSLCVAFGLPPTLLHQSLLAVACRSESCPPDALILPHAEHFCWHE